MKFLANENIPSVAAAMLEASGHDVLHVARACPGSSDTDILEQACSQGRIVITFDRDYGELVFRLKKPLPSGVVYLRFDPMWPTEPGEILAAVIANVPLEGRFTVVERHRIRQRPLPIA